MSLMLDPRQRAMLAEMGLKVWLPAHEPAAPPVQQAASPTAPVVQVAAAVPSAAPAAFSAPVASPRTPLAALQRAVAAEAEATAVVVAPALAADVAQAAAPTLPQVALPQVRPVQHVHDLSEQAVSNLHAEKNGGKASIPIEMGEMAATPLPAPVAAPVVARVNPPALPVVPSGPVAGMDWPELREAVANCRACNLCESRKQTVFGVGARRADWMVIGEAPGEQEDLRGEPFVGPAGQLLDAMLHAVGLNRQATEGEQAVFIANVLKCRPPGNRNPLPAEMAQCQPYLRRQVALVQPKIILAMGRFAVQTLLNTTEPIGRLRQQVHSYEGVPVIVSYHPAYLLRNLPEKAKAWADLVLAMQVAKAQQAATGAHNTGEITGH